MEILQAQIEAEISCLLGESPLWHPAQEKLYWVDIENKIIHSCKPGTNIISSAKIGKRVSALVPVNDTILLAAMQGSISLFNTTNGKIETLLKIETKKPNNRCNDGKCDKQGRFWIGTMDVDGANDCGALYYLSKDLSLTKVLTELSIPNGLDWSPVGDKMYFIDSADRCVKAFDFDAASGKISNAKTIIKINPDEMPDGMCTDSEGMLWIAFWGGKRVGRYDPYTSEHLADIRIPALNITSCTFGGKELTTLYITTARSGMTDAKLQEYPLSGSVFSCKMATRGQPVNFFNYQSNNHNL